MKIKKPITEQILDEFKSKIKKEIQNLSKEDVEKIIAITTNKIILEAKGFFLELFYSSELVGLFYISENNWKLATEDIKRRLTEPEDVSWN